jgi:hypothetical protein
MALQIFFEFWHQLKNLGAKLFFVCIYALMTNKHKPSTSAVAFNVYAR